MIEVGMTLLLKFPSFLLVFARLSAFFVAMPLFSYRTIPTVHKIAFSAMLSIVAFIPLPKPVFEIDATFFMLIVKEVAVGLSIGFTAYMIMAAIQIAGGFIDFQTGFAIANVFDPQTGAQTPLMGQFFYTLALMLMITLNIHHVIIDGAVYSFRFIPLDHFAPLASGEWIKFLVDTFRAMFVIAFKMAVPIVASLFLLDIALGILAKTVPQMNIFVVGMPVKLIVAFVLIMAMITIFITLDYQLLNKMLATIKDALLRLGR